MMKIYLRYITLPVIVLSQLMAHAMSPDSTSPKVPTYRPCCSPCSFDKSLAQHKFPNAPHEDQIAYAHGRSLLALLKHLHTAHMVYDQLVQNPTIGKGILQFREELAYCQAKISDFLLKHEPIDFNVCDNDGKTILILAAMTNQHSLIKDLLDDRLVDIDQMDKQGFTALLRAIEYGCVGSVRLLLEHHAIFPVLGTDCDFSQDRFEDSCVAIHADFIARADKSSEREFNRKGIETILREKYATRKSSSN